MIVVVKENKGCPRKYLQMKEPGQGAVLNKPESLKRRWVKGEGLGAEGGWKAETMGWQWRSNGDAPVLQVIIQSD